MCLRETATGYCLRRLENAPRDDTSGCACHLGHAPCSHCMSYAAACPAGCYREEEV